MCAEQETLRENTENLDIETNASTNVMAREGT